MSRAISSVQASQALTSGDDGQIHHKTQHKLERARVRSRSSEGPPRLVTTRERSWFGSDFAIEIGVLIKQHPMGPPTLTGGSGHAREERWNWGREAAFEAVLEPVAEVRDLVAADPSGGHDRGGGERSAGRPVNDHADQAGRQGRCPGGAGRLETGDRGPAARLRAGGREGRDRPVVGGVQGAGDQADAGGGKRRLGLSGRVPHRVDAATKAGLLGLLDDAVKQGWTLRRACRVLELGELRAYRWIGRRARGQLADRSPGGGPVHGILAEEAAEILALFDEWGEVDRSHRKLAHRGSYLGRLWVSPSTVRRVGSFSLLTSIFGRCRGRRSRRGDRSPSGPSTPQTRSGSTTRRISPRPRWRC